MKRPSFQSGVKGSGGSGAKGKAGIDGGMKRSTRQFLSTVYKPHSIQAFPSLQLSFIQANPHSFDPLNTLEEVLHVSTCPPLVAMRSPGNNQHPRRCPLGRHWL